MLCAGFDVESWILGVPAAVLFGVFATAPTPPPHPLRWLAVPGFLGYFVVQSFRTGLDVAQRALHPEREIHPGFCRYPARLPEGTPRAVFANMISLLPGSLSWSLEDGIHHVHLLAGHPLVFEELAELESRVGRLFGVDLPESQV